MPTIIAAFVTGGSARAPLTLFRRSRPHPHRHESDHMQDRYVGDVGDFVKYGLLRAIRGTKRLGVAWYLHPNVGPAGDGRHTAYLQNPDEWRHLDAELFDVLRELIAHRRSVANIQQSGILGNAAFAAERLEVAGIKVRDRPRWRNQWFGRIKRQLTDCDLVFADPDNGLVLNDRFRPTRQVYAKGIPLAEAMALAGRPSSAAASAAYQRIRPPIAAFHQLGGSASRPSEVGVGARPSPKLPRGG